LQNRRLQQLWIMYDNSAYFITLTQHSTTRWQTPKTRSHVSRPEMPFELTPIECKGHTAINLSQQNIDVHKSCTFLCNEEYLVTHDCTSCNVWFSYTSAVRPIKSIVAFGK
jgi:hypothetical protein